LSADMFPENGQLACYWNGQARKTNLTRFMVRSHCLSCRQL